MGKIMAVNISEKKGTQKKNIHSARLIEDFGIEKDAHAGKWHRQVSLLSYEKIEEFKAKGAPIDDGAFGENLIVSSATVDVSKEEWLEYREQMTGDEILIGIEEKDIMLLK